MKKLGSMAFVDDEEEEDLVPQSASKYYFEDDDKVPVSFADLPIQWSVKDKVDESATILYLRGTSGDGLLPLHKSVKAWRFDLSNFKPEISVLTKDNIWIKLQKPRKSYEELIRTVLVTLHSLQFLRRNPNASDKSLWEQFSRTFGSLDVRPSQNDLVDHIDLIAEAVKRDVNLAKSKFLLAFLAKKPTKKRLPDEDNPRDAISKFIVGDDMSLGADENDMDDDDDDYFDSVCAICDNGGDLLCCEGSCLRSFHATKKDGEDSFCDSLDLKKKQVEEIQSYFCGNCEHKIHQCFICYKLGSSDNSIGAEVFQCVSATCGYFYHPRCIARRLHLGDKAEAKAQEERIIAGESFTCPLHKCCVCTKGEVKTDANLQFAVCRRCPKSYHRKCLPREISFGEIEEEGTFTRAWDGLLHNRVLIYCLDHEIDEELMTPIRDHLKFPFTEEKKMLMKEQSKILDSHVGKDKARPKVNDLAVRDNCEKSSVKSFRRPFPSSKDGASTKKHGVDSLVPDSLGKEKEFDPSRKSILVRKKFQKNTEFEESCEADKNKVKVNEAREVAKTKVELKEACKADNNKVERVYNDLLESDLERRGLAVSVDSKHHRTDSIAPREPRCEVPTLDNDSKKRLLAVMEKATEEITMDTMLKKYKITSTHHTNSLKNLVDKTITMGKVKGSVQAVRTALKKLEDGENIEDAKAVCEPEVLSQIFKWKEKLRVYLAPFIHGARYTSYGRHFTKVDKLQQIVDRLHWYAEDGDMIVDFCCGANDFSWLMKSKLEETGKKCSYKNYDLIQAKNDFNFEMRDWLTVRKEELAPGSKLIMGLNPPFGVNASRANTFIEKALEFKPKILILIVPVETKRLDNAKSRYVLIWEDAMFLSGKSFYLPGSVDDEEKQMEDWNIVSPPLSLWSRPDFAAKHREIAEAHYHLSTKVGSSKLKENNEATNASLPPPRASADICDGNPMLIDSPLENVEHCALENEDVPMEIDEPELAESVDRNLVSEKIKSPKPATYEKHQSHPSPRRRRLKKMGNKKDYSEKVLGKSVDTSNETWKNKDVQEAPGELNTGPESIGTKIPERTTSDKQSPLQSDRDDIYDVCAPLSNSIVRFQESVEVSPPGTSRTRSNWEEDVREPDSTVRNRPSFVRSSSREDTYSVRPSPAHTGQKTHEALEASNAENSMSHFNDDLAAKYGFGGGYRMPDLPCMPDQFPLAPLPRDDPNEMFNYRSYSGVDARTQFHQYGQANDSREYLRRYGGHVDPMSAPTAPPPPPMMDNSPFPMQRYPPRFDELNYQRMDSLPPPPPLQPNGNSFYDSPSLPPPPPPPPPPGGIRSAPLSFAPGLDYQYYRGRPTGSAGWLNE